MNCSGCGSPIEPNERFCTVCGTTNSAASQQQPSYDFSTYGQRPANQQPVNSQQPVYNQQPTYGQQPVYNQQPTYGQQPAYGQQSFYQQPGYGQPTSYGQTSYVPVSRQRMVNVGGLLSAIAFIIGMFLPFFSEKWVGYFDGESGNFFKISDAMVVYGIILLLLALVAGIMGVCRISIPLIPVGVICGSVVLSIFMVYCYSNSYSMWGYSIRSFEPGAGFIIMLLGSIGMMICGIVGTARRV